MNDVSLLLNFDGGSEPSEIKRCFDAYADYLKTSADRFPAAARAYAQAPWHYDTTDPRCPHDAWLQKFSLLEAHPSSDSEENTIEMMLLGAYHDGNIIFRYRNVQLYSLVKNPQPEQMLKKFGPIDGHSDWLIDELSLTDDNVVVHTIDWAAGARWQIWCDDIEYEWRPFENAQFGD